MRKEVSILAITHDDRLALEEHEHEGYKVIQRPGSPPDNFRDMIEKILGSEHADRVQSFGRAVDTIVKPTETVELITDIYKIEIPNISKVQLPEKFLWYSRLQLSSDPRGKRDKRFHLRLLEKKPLNVRFSEKQLGKWIEAKMLYWHEDPS